jgi:hypothetical protein
MKEGGASSALTAPLRQRQITLMGGLVRRQVGGITWTNNQGGSVNQQQLVEIS